MVRSMPVEHQSIVRLLFTYYPLCLAIGATILNCLTFVILSQKIFHKRPAILFMRTIAVVDMILLYGWNLDHFFRLKFNFEVDRLSVVSCKISTYLNHFLNQSSAWLRVWMCVDRFCALNQIRHNRIAHQYRRVVFFILLTFIAIALVNLHLPIFACYIYQYNGTRISGGSRYFKLYPTWSYINLALYNIIPFILMLIFTTLIIRRLILVKRASSFQQSRIRHSSMSIPILVSAFLFCLMTTPPAIAFAFFHNHTYKKIFQDILLSLLDSIKYTYHSLSFALYFLTLVEFRREFFHFIRCRWINTTRISQLLTILGRRRSQRYKSSPTLVVTITK